MAATVAVIALFCGYWAHTSLTSVDAVMWADVELLCTARGGQMLLTECSL